jgi:hypothetical protein
VPAAPEQALQAGRSHQGEEKPPTVSPIIALRCSDFCHVVESDRLGQTTKTENGINLPEYPWLLTAIYDIRAGDRPAGWITASCNPCIV